MEERKITIENLEVNYKIFGSSSRAKASEDKTILVLHGWGAGSDAWVEAAVLMVQEGYQVIVPDMPGFGKSQAPKTAWRVDDYVDWVKNFADELKLKEFILIGHSFGGQAAAKFCAAHPERVDKLVLCAAAIIRRERLGRRQKIARFLSQGKIMEKYIPFGIYSLLRKAVYRVGGSKDYAMAQGIMAQIFQNVSKEDALERVRQIKAPTLIVWGEKDNETLLVDAYEISHQLINSKLITIPEAGHKLHRTHPQELKNIIFQFLK